MAPFPAVSLDQVSRLRESPHMTCPDHEFIVDQASTGLPVLKFLRQQMGDASWSVVRGLLRSRRIAVGGVVCVEEGRRLAEGERVAVTERPLAEPPGSDEVTIRYADARLVVADKPAGMLTMRRGAERARPARVRYQVPTLEESVALQLARGRAARRSGGRGGAGVRRGPLHPPRLWAVHRLDRETSGLVVFARDAETQGQLIEQFAKRTATRVYVAVIPSRGLDGKWFRQGVLTSELVRDRGDGVRGSVPVRDVDVGEAARDTKTAITHVRELSRFGERGEWMELECRLETGRTNQIRIQLAERGHPVCGDVKYRGPYGREPLDDKSGCPRLALHATELSFTHPAKGEELTFSSAWPEEMLRYLRAKRHGRG